MPESPAEQFWRYNIRVTNPVLSTVRSRIVESNAARIGLIISVCDQTQARVSPNQYLAITGGIKIGLAGLKVLEIRHTDYGGLAGVAWYGIAKDPSTLEIVEIILEKYPIGV